MLGTYNVWTNNGFEVKTHSSTLILQTIYYVHNIRPSSLHQKDFRV